MFVGQLTESERDIELIDVPIITPNGDFVVKSLSLQVSYFSGIFKIFLFFHLTLNSLKIKFDELKIRVKKTNFYLDKLLFMTRLFPFKTIFHPFTT